MRDQRFNGLTVGADVSRTEDGRDVACFVGGGFILPGLSNDVAQETKHPRTRPATTPPKGAASKRLKQVPVTADHALNSGTCP